MPDNLLTTNGPDRPDSVPDLFKSFRLSETGLEILGEPTFEDWFKVGQFINRSERAVHFWIGDWLNYGEKAWGDRYREAEEVTRFDNQTLRNDKWVASRISPDRRIPELSFTHHREVADLPPEEQDQLLQIAKENNLSREKFVKVVKQHGMPLQEQQMSPRGDKQNEAQKLIDVMLSLQRQCDDARFDQFTEEERFALTTNAKNLALSLQTFITLYEHTEDPGL